LWSSVFLMAALTSTGVSAQQGAGPNDAWQFGLSIYGWFPDIAGQTNFTTPSGSSEFEIDIEDILDNLEFTMMGTFDVRKGRWGVLTDLIYMDVDGSKSGTREASIGGGALPVNVAADVDIELESWIWTIAAYYRALQQDGSNLDITAGVRYLDIEQSVNWNITGNVGPIPAADRMGAAEANLSNWDIILGVRGRFAFGGQESWFVPYYLDLGTGDSDFTWQGVGGLGYAFQWWEITVAWRYLYYDLPSDKRIKDLDFSGPVIGATFRW
jgi:hypothetical protein